MDAISFNNNNKNTQKIQHNDDDKEGFNASDMRALCPQD